MMEIERFSAFCDGPTGGNSAGVLLCSELPTDVDMQLLAREVEYSETVFAAPMDTRWRVRYFAPEIEVPFCGHATIALGGALAKARGNGVYSLILNNTQITVEGQRQNRSMWAALQSQRTATEEISRKAADSARELFSIKLSDLDDGIPTVAATAGARPYILAAKSTNALRDLHYDFDSGRKWMLNAGITAVLIRFLKLPGFSTRETHSLLEAFTKILRRERPQMRSPDT